MITCKEFLKELSEYLDDSVDRDIRERLQTHVTECPNCWVICDTTKKTLQIYKGMNPHAIPQDIHDRLMQALQKKMADCKRPPSVC